MLEAEITATGDVTVEGQHVGNLLGFHFVADPQAGGDEAKTLRNAAAKALAGEIEARAERFSAAADTSLVLSNDGTIRWQGDPVAKLEPGDQIFEPRLRILADDQLTGPAREKVETRLRAWLKASIVRLLGPLLQLQASAELTGLARGIAYQIAEALGVLERSKVLQEMRSLDQDGRAALRKQGVRFGAYHIYLPALLKPAPRILAAQLWALKNGGLDQKGIDEIAHLAGSGRTSIPVDPEIAKGLYRAAGFRVCGGRAVRVDILERLADLIRPAIAYRPGLTPGAPPPGTADGEWFAPTVSMTSLVGCSGEDFSSILRSLGYVMERRAGPAITAPLVPAASPAAIPTPVPPGAEGDADASSTESPAAPAAEVGQASPDGGVASPAEADAAGMAPAVEEASPETPAVEIVPDAAADEVEASSGTEAIEPDAADMRGQGLDSAGLAPSEADELTAPALGEPEQAAPEPASAPSRPASQEASPAEGASEAGAGTPDAAAPQADAAGTPAEPVMIEVWRLHRQNRDHRARQDRRAQGQRSEERRSEGERPRQEGQRQGQRPDRGRRGGQRPEGRPQGDRGPRPDQRAEGRGDGGRSAESRGRGPDERRGPSRRHEEPGQRGPDRQRPERRERAPDPNSPFAKLLALKAQLEARDGDKR